MLVGHGLWTCGSTEPTSSQVAIEIMTRRCQAETRAWRDCKRRLIAAPIRPAADRRLRGWQRYLWERDSPSLVDELPEVVLSSSTCDRSVSLDVASAFEVDAAEWDLGRECEIRAAALATPMPSYIRALTAG